MRGLLLLGLLALLGYGAYCFLGSSPTVSLKGSPSPSAASNSSASSGKTLTFPSSVQGRYRSDVFVNANAIKGIPQLNDKQKSLLMDDVRKGEILVVKPAEIVDVVGSKSLSLPIRIVSIDGNAILMEHFSEKLKTTVHSRMDFDQTGVWLHTDTPPPGYSLRFLRIK